MSTLAVPAARPDDAYAEEWRPFEVDPGPLVFVVGCQRSGTTLLHLELARSGHFRYLTAYDVVAYDRVIYEQRHGLAQTSRLNFAEQLAENDRGIDAIPAGPDTPEEYGLITGPGGVRYKRPDTSEATLPRLRELCAKKALLGGRAQPLLLKSPPDYADAIPLLARAWPSARFVAIHRHPLATLHSQLRAWRELVLRRHAYLALLDPGYRALFADPTRRMHLGLFLHSPAGAGWLADAIAAAHSRFLAIERSGAFDDRLVSIRYEDLCADPASTLDRVSSHLGVEVRRPTFRAAPRREAGSNVALEAFAARRRAFAPYMARFGYEEGADL